MKYPVKDEEERELEQELAQVQRENRKRRLREQIERERRSVGPSVPFRTGPAHLPRIDMTVPEVVDLRHLR